ncbi:MAG: DUF2089 family protein [Pseudobdellovibrio sp.]
MHKIDSNLACPSCRETLEPTVLSCHHCDIRVEGPFQFNEFASLSGDDLHFLRIFIRCEGRVRDMEPALGLSYPTIRTRLTQLKNKLLSDVPSEEKKLSKNLTDAEILSQLEKGEIAFEEAMQLIKKGPKS